MVSRERVERLQMPKSEGVRLAIASVGEETGTLLREYLELEGVYNPDSLAVVCYGARAYPDRLALNKNCYTNKMIRLHLMENAGVRVIPWFRAGNRIPENIEFPLFARTKYGQRGEDIIPVFEPEEVEWRADAGWDWFSQYIPTAQEFRVWVFRGECLGVYERVMERPLDYKNLGRSFSNGFAFMRRIHHGPKVREAIKAVAALQLDFGAVDLIHGRDGVFYILEVNTAPGVIKSKCTLVLQRLSQCIVQWARDGYPARSD